MYNNIYNNTLRPLSRSSSPQTSLRPSLRPNLRPNLRPTLNFKGIRETDPNIIAISSPETQKMYEAANKVLENPDYVMNEKSLFGLFGEKTQQFINALSNKQTQEDAKKVKQGLDIIA